MGQVERVAVFELYERAIEEPSGIGKGKMRPFVDERVGEIPGERLGDDEVGQVPVGDEEGIFGVEEAGELLFKLRVEDVVSGGEPGSSDVQAVFFDARLQSGNYLRMAGEAKIVAAGKVGEFAVAKADEGAVDLLECGRRRHSRG